MPLYLTGSSLLHRCKSGCNSGMLGRKLGIGARCSPTLQLHMPTCHGQHCPYAGDTCWGELEGAS